VDLLHQDFPELWKLGIYMEDAPQDWAKNSKKYKNLAQPIIKALEMGKAKELALAPQS
jgi:agmatinase